jgi:hypothetical protein
MMAIVDNNKVTQYRVNLKVTFEVATNRPRAARRHARPPRPAGGSPRPRRGAARPRRGRPFSAP